MDPSKINIDGYLIKEVLGQGGMATVYLAIQESFEREVAIKVMSEQLSADASFQERFLQEAKIVAKLVHANIVTVYDVGVVNNHHFLSMEYIKGVDLKQLIDSISLFHLIRVIKEVSLALDYAGRKGYVHRDIKPENIMINNEDGRAVIMDFGIAKAFDSVSDMTQTGTAVGTPYYMSPEQAKGRHIDWRSDIYSLGVVFFHALSGQLPYQGDSAVSIGIKHLSDPIPALPEFMRNAFQPIINKMMAKLPEERYQNGQEIINALSQIPEAKLKEINQEFIKQGHKDSGNNLNYDITGNFTDRTEVLSAQDLDDATKVIHVTARTAVIKETPKSNRFIYLLALIAIIAGVGYFNPNNIADPALEKADEIYRQWTNQPSKAELKRLADLAKAKQAAQAEAEKLARQKEQEKRERLEQLTAEAIRLEKEIISNKAMVDELYQTYQLISLLEEDHPALNFELVKEVYIKLIEEQLLSNKPDSAQQTLSDAMKKFPELESHDKIIEFKRQIVDLKQVSQLLTAANRMLAEGKLLGSGEDNALHHFQQVQKISPENPNAAQGVAAIADAVHQQASELFSQNQLTQALNYIEAGEALPSQHQSKLSQLKEQIINAQQAQKEEAERQAQLAAQEAERKAQLLARQTQITTLMDSAKLAQASDDLVKTNSSAYARYQEVLKLDPNHQGALTGLNEIEQLLISQIPPLVEQQQFDQAEQQLKQIGTKFPNSQQIAVQQSAINKAREAYIIATSPRLINITIKGQDFSQLSNSSNLKVSAENTIFIGFKYENFGEQTRVIQAELYAGSQNDKLSTTSVIITKDSGVKYFKISRPVAGFTKGGYYLDFKMGQDTVETKPFSIE